MNKPVVLCILDGCGLREESDGNAFKNATKPTLDMLFNKYPHSILQASGPSVGLPEGQMGTSEVGHMNLGSGRIALQPLQAITQSIESKELNKNEKILDVLNHVRENNSNLHIMGLLSDGGVHSHINHLLALLDICKENNIENVYIDVMLDGRDTYEKSAIKYLDILQKKLDEIKIGKIATISGRYYGMDRDNNYDRVKLSYDAICYGEGPLYNNYKELIDENYKKELYDEFVIPGIINKCPIKDNDGVITFNFRKDRIREMFTLLSNPEAYKEKASDKGLNVITYNNLKTLTMYPVTETVLSPHAFNDLDLKNILVDYLHNNGVSQLRIAETEKYPHVTFFFDGGKEVEYDDMKKILIPSPKVATYDLKPEMSVYEVTDNFLKEVGNYDVTIMNLANGDMVGHTGVYEAAVEAVEDMDKCLAKIYKRTVEELGGILLIIADHGNCDMMWDSEHKPVTSHTTNPVPCIITKKGIELNDGKLADIAPTMLELIGLPIPKEMTGNSLIRK
ncbi:MAG: 2,3-bisphosphoglycerate-independent phosphoglycerate mutase [Mollicutes bacterium]|nr:2,3-bisphosphoglycerate-independent phosphoglycerate mutase [Mollicutes bacterium]